MPPIEHAPLPTPKPLDTPPAVVPHPDNAPPADAKTIAGRQLRVRTLTETFRERLLIGLLNQELARKAVEAMISVLDKGADPDRVVLLRELLKHVPPPAEVISAAQHTNVVAIQVNAKLKRGRKEYA